MPGVIQDQRLNAFLDRLHAASAGQSDVVNRYFAGRVARGDLNWTEFDDDATRFFADKMVALDRNKAEFCYLLCRALQAHRVVEAGTSFGVSTLYLAAAVRDNGIPNAKVIGTEHEPTKAAAARANFREAGLDNFIELREGDLRQTLRDLSGPIDFMLIDIWEVALPALRLATPHLRPGGLVVCDNTAAFPEYYQDYMAFIDDPVNRLRTQTLPFDGGLELTVKI